MKHLFIINPVAGKTDQTQQFSANIKVFFHSRSDSYEICVSQSKGDCEKIARTACQLGLPLRIYACGGDGTLNEVVNGVAGFSHVAITHYPCGTGNDFIKIFSNPNQFRDLAALVDGDEAEFDLIQGGDRYALNICSLGLDANIARQVHTYKQLPLVSGHGAYCLSSAVNVIKGLSHHYIIEVDGERIDAKQTLICVANGRYYGGGFYPVPEALPDDGMLDVLLVKSVSRFTVARLFSKYITGQYSQIPQHIRHIPCRSITVTCDREQAVNLDGELLVRKHLTFAVAKDKIRFFYPKGQNWLPKVGGNESLSAQY